MIDSSHVAANNPPSLVVHGGKVDHMGCTIEFNSLFPTAEAQALRDSLISLPRFLDQVGVALKMNWSVHDNVRNEHNSASEVAHAQADVQDAVANKVDTSVKVHDVVDLENNHSDGENNYTPGNPFCFRTGTNVPFEWITFRYSYEFCYFV